MNTTTHIQPSAPPSAGNMRAASHGARPSQSQSSPVGADLPLVGVVPFGLPSVILLAGWTLLVLALAGPFLVLVTVVLATAIVVVLAAAVVALPYLAFRALHSYRVRRPRRRRVLDRAAQVPTAAQLLSPAHRHVPVHLQTSTQPALTSK